MTDVDVSYPCIIDPSHFDLIIVGTGLPESIIAAASSATGKSVLHLDPNAFYGANFSSLPLDEFVSFLNSQPASTEQHSHLSTSSSDYVAVDLKSKCLYSDIEISSHESSEDFGPSKKFNLDLSGPRVLFCADSIVNLMLKSGASHHIEFKSIDASFIYSHDGKLSKVPASRNAMFNDKSLKPTEKRKLMKFFELVQQNIECNLSKQKEQRTISSEKLESPFVDFLTEQNLTSKIKSIILYAIAMVDYDQEAPEFCGTILKTKDGIERLAHYQSSIGKFPNALGAFIYPMYGQGELPQAFCRCAAVNGSLYVLRMTVKSLLLDKESRQYKGLELASGQEIFSNQLIMGPEFMDLVPSLLSSHPDVQKERSDGPTVGETERQVARAVCIARGSIMSGLSNLLVIFPPRSLYPEQMASVRVLQLGSNLAVCPSGLFVLYLSVLCDDHAQGKESLHAAIKALYKCSISEHQHHVQDENREEATPILIWSTMYIQQLTKGSSDSISLCPMPDGNLDYRNIVESTEKVFHMVYPDEEFMSERNSSEDTADELESD